MTKLQDKGKIFLAQQYIYPCIAKDKSYTYIWASLKQQLLKKEKAKDCF